MSRLGAWPLLAGVFLLIAGTGCQFRTAPFYPIGIYSVPGTNDLAALKQAGFNVVTGPASADFLNSARRHGLKVMASPNTSAGPHFQSARARSVISQHDSHPALWAWYLVDEPDLNRIPPQDVLNAHRFLKRAGARKPTALVLYFANSALYYANIADITMVDRYPIPWLPLADLPKHLRMARLSLGPDKPLIAVIQAFDWSYYPDHLVVNHPLRAPTYEELRCMVYCALVQRATGLFFYSYDSGDWKILQHPEVWQALQKVVSEVNERLPLFQGEHLWWPYVHYYSDPSLSFNQALEGSVTVALVRVKHGNALFPKGDYIVAVNNTERQIGYRVSLPEPFGGALRVVGENRYTVIENDFLEDEFEPYAVHVYGPLP